MIEVAQIGFGCSLDGCGHVRGWPLRIQFGSVGPEVTVDQMLEGRGHAVVHAAQLTELVRGMAGTDMLIRLQEPVPVAAGDLISLLTQAGYRVELC